MLLGEGRKARERTAVHIYLSDRLFVAMTKRLGISRRRLQRLKESQRLSNTRGVRVSLFSTARLLGWLSPQQAQWLVEEGQRVACACPEYADGVVTLPLEADCEWVPEDAIEELEELPGGLAPVQVEATWEPERFSQDDLLPLEQGDFDAVQVDYGPTTQDRYDFASSSERRSPFLVTASDEAFSVTPSDLSPPQVDDLLDLLEDLPEQPLEEQRLLELFDQASEPAAAPLPLQATWDAKRAPLAAGAANLFDLAANFPAEDPFAAAARATGDEPVDPFAAAASAWQPASHDPFAPTTEEPFTLGGANDPLIDLLEAGGGDLPADSALFDVDWAGMESGVGSQPAFL